MKNKANVLLGIIFLAVTIAFLSLGFSNMHKNNNYWINFLVAAFFLVVTLYSFIKGFNRNPQ